MLIVPEFLKTPGAFWSFGVVEKAKEKPEWLLGLLEMVCSVYTVSPAKRLRKIDITKDAQFVFFSPQNQNLLRIPLRNHQNNP